MNLALIRYREAPRRILGYRASAILRWDGGSWGLSRCSTKPSTAVSLVVRRVPSVLSTEVEKTTSLRSSSGPVTGE